MIGALQLGFSFRGYANKNAEGILVNSMGFLLVVLAIVVGFVVTNDNFRRRPSPEEQQLIMTPEPKSPAGDE